MRLNILLIILLLAFSGCTDEPELEKYTTRFVNESSVTLTIRGYARNNNLVYSEKVIANSKGEDCITSTEGFLGYNCAGDSIVFKFPNDKGYICSIRITNENPELCFFDNVSPFGDSSSFRNVDGNIFEFVITQSDFENALDIPE